VSKKNRRRTGTSGDSADAADTSLAELWAPIATGDLLRAEIKTSETLALLSATDATRDEIEDLNAAIVSAAARQLSASDAAAFYRLLMSLGSPSVKRLASQALGTLTSEGVYPSEWVTDIGKPVPVQAQRHYDVFGDRELIIVTFSYGEAEHAIVVGVDLTALPVVGMVRAIDDTARLIETLHNRDDPFDRWEQIPLAEARRRIEVPLTRASQGLVQDLSLSSAVYLPLARSRVRRLPTDEARPGVKFTAADRAAAVEEFLRSAQAAEVGNAETARFWAEVLTGYSSRVPDEPPAQVGPGKLSAMLSAHVANTFALSATQRELLRPVVTAWTRWAAARQELDEAATEHLMAHLPKAFDEFESAYDDRHSIVARQYVHDLATGDVDVAWLEDSLTRRVCAVPFPEDRDPDGGAAFLNATDPDHRAVLATSEFVSCQPDDAARKQFIAAVKRVIEELWHGDPPTTWQTAKRLLAEGHSRHDTIHTLAEH
jgi:hypothetical protein